MLYRITIDLSGVSPKLAEAIVNALRVQFENQGLQNHVDAITLKNMEVENAQPEKAG